MACCRLRWFTALGRNKPHPRVGHSGVQALPAGSVCKAARGAGDSVAAPPGEGHVTPQGRANISAGGWTLVAPTPGPKTCERIVPTRSAFFAPAAHALGAFGTCVLISCGSAETNTTPSTRELSGMEVFDVSAVDAVTANGYALTSGVCEVESPERYRPSDNIFGGLLVFHAFRAASGEAPGEVTLLFASNHTARAGPGLAIPVNAAAISLGTGLPPGGQLNDPITPDMPGAQAALQCARSAGGPATVEVKGLDVEEWRAQAIEGFGPEEVFDDGSRSDYVRIARVICQEDPARMRRTMGSAYDGSLQEFIFDTFCPYI